MGPARARLPRLAAGVLLVALAAAAPAASGARTPVIRTAAGGLGTGPPREVGFYISGLAVSGSTVYVADPMWKVVRGMDTRGRTTWVAAGNGSTYPDGKGGRATRIAIGGPGGVAAHPGGGFVVAGGRLVHRVDRSGNATVVAGGGMLTGVAVEGARARDVRLSDMDGVAVGPDGTIYVSATSQDQVLAFSPDGLTRVVAGSGVRGFAGLGGPARTLSMNRPGGLVVTKAGDVVVTDTWNDRVVRIDRLGLSHAFAGTGTRGRAADDGATGPAVAANLFLPTDVVQLPSGDVLVTSGSTVRRVRQDGTISTFLRDYGGPLAAAPNGDVWIAEGGEVHLHRNGRTVRMAGNSRREPSGYSVLRGGHPALLQTMTPISVATFRDTVYWADVDDKVWRLRGGRAAFATTNSEPYFDPFNIAPGHGELVTSISGITVSPTGGVYVSTGSANQVFRLAGTRRLHVAGEFNICWVGEKPPEGDGGRATDATLCGPSGMAASRTDLYIADSGHSRIRAVDARGRIRSVAGGDTAGFAGDGGPARDALLRYPFDVALAPDGSLYVADTQNHVVRRIDRRGIIRTVAGTPGKAGYAGDGGPATAAMLHHPEGVAVGPDGTLYVADTYNSVIRRVDRRGVVTTLAGTGVASFGGDGGAARSAGLAYPSDVDVDATGRRLYVADADNHRVRVILL